MSAITAPSGPFLLGLLGAKPKEPELSKIAAKLKAGVAPPPKKPDLSKTSASTIRAAVEETAKLKGAIPRSPKRFHLDKRVPSILAVDAAEDDDDLLTTRETANWLQVSQQWLSIGRHRGYGPPFTQCSTGVLRYRRGDVRRWLKARTFQSTKEYDARRPQP
jgi:hypothetical protein